MKDKTTTRTVSWMVAALLASSHADAAKPASNAPVQDQAIQRWQDARFGMFIHWGPVSLKGTEIGWSRGGEIPIAEYDELYKRFNPVKFNADEWVAVAKAAGMKYMVLTTKHHDGFCLWDTKQTDYNIMNSPFKRDVVKELAAACKKGGIQFGTYYSTTDWHHPDFPLTSPGGSVGRKEHNLDRYTDYLKAQTKELLTQYGPLFTLWYDVPQMTLQGSAMDLKPLNAVPAGLITPQMKATASTIYQNDPKYAAAMAIDGDPSTRWATPEGARQCSLEIDLLKPLTFATIEIDEAYAEPVSRVKKFELQKNENGNWVKFHEGTTLGTAFRASFPPVTAQHVRLLVLDAADGPTISEIRLHAAAVE